MKNIILLIFLFCSCLAFPIESFSDDNLGKSSEQIEATPIAVTFLNGQLTIVNAPTNSKVEVFTILGVSIFRAVTVEQKEVFLLDLNKGYYIIKVAKTTKKISVK